MRQVNWEPLPSPNDHIGRMSISLTNKLFGKWPLKILDTKVTADQVLYNKFDRIIINLLLQIGPSIVHLKMDAFFGKACLLHTTVPEEPLLQRMTHYLYCDWWLPAALAKWILLHGEAIQVYNIIHNNLKVLLLLSC